MSQPIATVHEALQQLTAEYDLRGSELQAALDREQSLNGEIEKLRLELLEERARRAVSHPTPTAPPSSGLTSKSPDFALHSSYRDNGAGINPALIPTTSDVLSPLAQMRTGRPLVDDEVKPPPPSSEEKPYESSYTEFVGVTNAVVPAKSHSKQFDQVLNILQRAIESDKSRPNSIRSALRSLVIGAFKALHNQMNVRDMVLLVMIANRLWPYIQIGRAHV